MHHCALLSLGYRQESRGDVCLFVASSTWHSFKIFTGVLNQRLTDWAENNDISSDSQFGFRRGRST